MRSWNRCWLVGAELGYSCAVFSSHLQQEGVAKCRERIGRDSLPDLPHEVKVKPDVMNGVVDQCRDLSADIQVTQICPRNGAARDTSALRVEGIRIGGELCVFD